MLLVILGVSGVGKSYFVNEITKRYDFKKVNTIRTRKIRPNEINKDVGIFMSLDEFYKLKESGDIIYDSLIFDNIYAYKKEELLSSDNYVSELYYTMLDDWKKFRPDLVSICLVPNEFSKAVLEIKKRGLTKEQEEERIKDAKIQYDMVLNDKDFRNKIDYIIYNNYDEESKERILNLVGKIIDEDI